MRRRRDGQPASSRPSLYAPVERVWQVLCGEGLVEQWLGCLGYRSEIGHVFYMQPDAAERAAGDVSGATHCELLTLEPPHRMAFWSYSVTPKTTLTLNLATSGGGTRVSLRHDGWDQCAEADIEAVRDMLAGGWSSFVLPGLKRLSKAPGG